MRPPRSCVLVQRKKLQKQSHCKTNKQKQPRTLAPCHTTPDQLPEEYRQSKPTHIEHMRVFESRRYYLVHFENSNLYPIYLHRDNGINLNAFIKEFKNSDGPLVPGDLDEIEWEVQSIEKSRFIDGKYEYLVIWKHWIGEPTWINEDDCDCMNLIATYENPKLERMLNFSTNNRRLWVDSKRMNIFMKRIITSSDSQVNLLDCSDDMCLSWSHNLKEGLNIGCTKFDQHWYVVFIFLNSICVTHTILVADSLNTMLAPNITHHPIQLRLKAAFPKYPIKPIKMTPMDRSDMCAFYVLAAIERALFIFDPRAKFIAESICFHPTRAEYLRSVLDPKTNGELTLSIRSKDPTFTCPTCEFCRKDFDDFKQLDAHIIGSHILLSSNSTLNGTRYTKSIVASVSQTYIKIEQSQ